MESVQIVKSKGLSGSTLKLIAMISMLIDHGAFILFGPVLIENGIYSVGNLSPDYIKELFAAGYVGYVYVAYQVMRRLVGRIAFPIYCFLLVEGFQRTGSRTKYALRLFLFALISEIPFDLAFYGTVFDWNHGNVFFTLWIAFLMLYLWEAVKEKAENPWLIWGIDIIIFLAAVLSAEFIHCDYGAKGIIAIALLYMFRKERKEQLIAGCVAFIWEITAPLAFIFVAFYNGKKGLKLKYIFYVFYPAHLLLLYLIHLKFL
ncbi:MAG: conjugal transfer protein TraX [Lachnospiraceae bacterium]|nr:conjugal transfer protein TraX [Lachnospiraceae bacterium]